MNEHRYWYTFDFKDVTVSYGLMGWCFGADEDAARESARRYEHGQKNRAEFVRGQIGKARIYLQHHTGCACRPANERVW